MGVAFRLAWIAAAAGLTLSAQALSNASLAGKYGFREVLLSSGSVQTLFGTLTFDGKGGYSYSGQLLSGSSAPTNSSGTAGTYAVQSGGQATISDPLQTGAPINARLGNGLLIGSNTEAGNTYSIFAAVPAAASAIPLSALNGNYWLASLEFLNGSVDFARETLFPMIANGSGGFGSPRATGEAVNLGNALTSQVVNGVTYAINADGSGSLSMPSAGDPSQLIGGVKTIYVSSDGNFFIGGGAGAGGQGLVVGIRAATNPTATILSGVYWSADLYLRGQLNSCYIGSADALSDGATMTWSKRLRETGGTLDITTVSGFTVNADSSGTILDNNIAVSANGQLFVGSGLTGLGTDRYELFLGVKALPASGTGLFLNPLGVVNVFSFAPPGNPIAPGEFITIFGSGLPAQKAVSVPFPATLGGVQLMINNTPAPLYLITATQVFAVVPYSLTGNSATIVLTNGGTSSNTITVPVAPTSPGIATQPQNGLGNGAITHANGSLVTPSSPAQRGETVVMYLTGLGAVSPAVADGAAAPSKAPLSTTKSVLTIYLNGVCPNSPNCDASNISFQGLTPGYAGLYQVNFTIPLTAASGSAVPLAIQTTNGFADMVSIAIQ